MLSTVRPAGDDILQDERWDGEDDHDRSPGDSKKEASETLYLDLFGNSSNSLFTKNRGIGTILNDD